MRNTELKTSWITSDLYKAAGLIASAEKEDSAEIALLRARAAVLTAERALGGIKEWTRKLEKGER